ncbi:hypothetical protein CIB84_009355, partial [Bambusicola thoracicus]
AFKTKDGYIVVGAGNDQQFVTVCQVMIYEVASTSMCMDFRLLNCTEIEECGSQQNSVKTVRVMFCVKGKILNLPEVIKDSRYKTNKLRVQNRKELIDILSTR